MGSSKGGGKQTVGYRYFLGVHFVLCHGPVDELSRIDVGGRKAWPSEDELDHLTDTIGTEYDSDDQSFAARLLGIEDGSNTGSDDDGWEGPKTESGKITVYKPELFGGDDKEGGVWGVADVAFGEEDQSPNAYLQSQLGDDIPSFRGVVSVILRQFYVGMNPYLKDWAFVVKRCLTRSDGYEQWYSDKAQIGEDMNPAHIIREVLTSEEWGLGEPEEEIDDDSFFEAADTLHDEEFGLSLIWNARETVGDFLSSILDHIDAALYLDPSTGKWALKLIRDDYSVDDLPVYSESEIISLEDFSQAGSGEKINELTLTWKDQEAGKDRSLTVHNIAEIQRQGNRVSKEIKRPGITNEQLAMKVASRELRQRSMSLASCRVRGNREMADLRPGDVIALEWPPLGIDRLVMRVGQVDYGTLENGEVSLDLMEDIFGVGEAIYTGSGGTLWESPVNEPSNIKEYEVLEAPYYMVVRDLLGESDSGYSDLEDGSGVYLALAKRPFGDATQYRIYDDEDGGSFEERRAADWSPGGKLHESISGSEVTTEVTLDDAEDLAKVFEGALALVGDEWAVVDSIDWKEATVTLARGVLDTPPTAHDAGTKVFFYVDSDALSRNELLEDEQVEVRLQTETGLGRENLEDTVSSSVRIDSRLWRPYAPGNLRINGSRYKKTIRDTELGIYWSHRDRTEQTGSTIIRQDDDDVGPESNVSYELYLRDVEEDEPILDRELETDTSWVDDGHEESTSADKAPWHVEVKLRSVRDGYQSWKDHKHTFERHGYGFCYPDSDGNTNYGGYEE